MKKEEHQHEYIPLTYRYTKWHKSKRVEATVKDHDEIIVASFVCKYHLGEVVHIPYL